MLEPSIFVTKPSLPPLSDVLPMLECIWNSKNLTNGGPFHQQLEARLSDYLGVENISLFANGTLALIAALKALNISGEVITTPYSFVATANAILWSGLTPVFVDIDPVTLNICPSAIENAITEQTCAILPVHCYGNMCDVDRIQHIADKYRLKVIYDAAHAFGVRCHCGSILEHGDASILSFHATKVFNTLEGGAVISSTSDIKRTVDQLKNFGFESEVLSSCVGINAKLNEVQAAIGLLQLDHIDNYIQERSVQADRYSNLFSSFEAVTPVFGCQLRSNYSYYPILINKSSTIDRDHVYDVLKSHGIYTRRYFYPLITDFPMYRQSSIDSGADFINARDAASRILCLPIYPGLSEYEQLNVVKTISECLYH